ncbi:hypothetical protein NN3_17610 [Nocardia neocaledoniensis NBRC 108232]|uniref:Uncharacterized protein n=1 Tax=Nocardia neocaledoniensis TaxID=236511 RepID=A0A317NYU0_9NOCA|nr:hypothetical protein [Nocardia neocaledoniensis]PWV79314.1 hypothetical protein DFR69_102377 [Nocardia neocaledoniensis]GEM30754.1 hypothetical protein NN3_17610 [Nocardia neocaledoniensis NBRC 108232]
MAMHAVPDRGDDGRVWTLDAPRQEQARHRAPSPSRGTVLALRSIPVFGWAFLLLGVVRPFRSRLLRVAFWIDVVLSVGVHAAQIPAARRVAAERGIAPGRAAVMTMLFGATWWKTLGEEPR